MIPVRILDLPAFRIAGRSTYISGPDNEQFGRFWQACQESGLMDTFADLTGFRPGAQTGATTLGVSRVEKDPARRDFDYMIAVEVGQDADTLDLETYTVPAGRWAVFACPSPDAAGVVTAIVAAEMYCFTEWLPQSGYAHALAPEMEVYLPDEKGEKRTEFWLPIRPL